MTDWVTPIVGFTGVLVGSGTLIVVEMLRLRREAKARANEALTSQCGRLLAAVNEIGKFATIHRAYAEAGSQDPAWMQVMVDLLSALGDAKQAISELGLSGPNSIADWCKIVLNETIRPLLPLIGGAVSVPESPLTSKNTGMGSDRAEELFRFLVRQHLGLDLPQISSQPGQSTPFIG